MIDGNSFSIKTVLVVDDQPLILQLVATMLHRQGYAVLAADSPEQALGIARQLEQPIDLIVSDVLMPGFDGIELLKRILVIRPQLRVLLMSGDCQLAGEAVPFISKPFTATELALKIKEVLGECP